MTGADVANNELGYTGKGVKVGVIDSGIDYNHPDFGGSGVNDETKDFPGARVQYGYDLVGNDYDSGNPEHDVPKPDMFPDDCGDHGSHVAGIIGANDKVKGVAPEVTFGSYRVFGCDGSSSSDVIVEAMERAYDDGMDIINMSLGASFATWPSYPTAVAADELVEKGLTVVVSQGNEGASGVFSGGAPAVAHNVISVGSVDNAKYMASYFTAAGTDFPYSPSSGSPAFSPSATFELVAAEPLDACAGLPKATAENQAVLVQRGTCSFREKAQAGEQAGHAAVLIFNNADGVINATVEGEPAISIPVGTLLKADGEKLLAEIKAKGSTSITIGAEAKRFDNPTGGYQSDFSSYGLAADLTLNPDVSAPGGSIYSTVPLEHGGYATMGGTSMAAPHVAGAAALVLQAKPDLDPLGLRTVLTNTADPFEWGKMPGKGLLEPVHRQGGGLIDIPQAVQTAVTVEASKISLGEGEAGPVTTTLKVTNSSNTAKTFRLGVKHGVATYGKTSSDFGFYALEADVQFSADSVTVPAGKTATVKVTIGEDFGEDGAIYGGWVTLTNDTEAFSVPFAGLSGDYQALTALEYAHLTKVIDDKGNLDIAEPMHQYSMVGDDLPAIFFNITFPVQSIHVDVYKANADGSKGQLVHKNFHNFATLTDEGRFKSGIALPWDGTYKGNNGKNGKLRRVANGDYILEMRVLKALGDPNNPAHWETWDSPAFTVQYGDGADTSTGNGPKPGKGKGRKG